MKQNRESERQTGRASRRRRTVQGAADTVDTFGSKAIAKFLEGYTRLSIEDACKATPLGLDKENLTVWVNRAGKWEDVPTPKQWKPTQLLCREVVTKIFGLSSEQYEAMRDVFDDLDSPDLMGVYRQNEDREKYAIVIRLPERDKYGTLKVGGTAGAGVLAGVLGTMGYEKWKDEKEKWFEAYKNFLLYHEHFRKSLGQLESELDLLQDRPLKVPELTPELKSFIFDWEYCRVFRRLNCFESVGDNILLKLHRPTLAMQIDLELKKKKNGEIFSNDYYKKLLTKKSEGNAKDDEAKGNKEKSQIIEKLRDQVIQDATFISEQYDYLDGNRRWTMREENPAIVN